MKTIILAACVALALAACERKGPVEKPGENVRDAVKK
jgi:predicted small lipoprotein YifL